MFGMPGLGLLAGYIITAASQPPYVIENGQHHQAKQDAEPKHCKGVLHPGPGGPAGHGLVGHEQELAAVQHRDWQQIQDT